MDIEFAYRILDEKFYPQILVLLLILEQQRVGGANIRANNDEVAL